MDHLDFDISHLLAGSLVLLSFVLLYQDRLYALLNVYALHALALALSVGWQAYIQDAPHLYVTAAIALGFKAIAIPMVLRRIVERLGIHREIETAVGIGLTMLAGIALVALSMVVMLRVTGKANPIAREDLALALAVVLLGLLIMVTRRNAVGQVVGFMSLENGLVLAATGAKGMPLVVEISVAFSILVGFTTSIFSASYVGHELETGRLTPAYLRFYHAMYQILMFAMNLALVANNIGLMWVAIEIATMTTVMMVGIYRTHEALEAAWKYFILGSVGIALALFGTILVYVAAQPVIGEGLDAMVWTELVGHAASFDPALLNVAFVFLLLGYGTKVGLAPLHAWLPDAHAEGPTPISAVLSWLLLNVALYAGLGFKVLMTANAVAVAPGPLMVTLGLGSLVFAAFMLYRRRDINPMFAY